MSITEKIIITDTNIITDLDHANLLEEFVSLEGIYISDMVMNDEINSKTGNVSLIHRIPVISSSSLQLLEANKLSGIEKKLSTYDLLNYIIARDHHLILATGDNRLKEYSEFHGVTVIRTLKIIQLMVERGVISLNKVQRACHLLKECPTTRIPGEIIEEFVRQLEKDSIAT